MLGRLLVGFIAGAVAVVTVHDAVIGILANATSLLPPTAKPWNLDPFKTPFGFDIPRLVNNMFWGGVLGAVYSQIHQYLPGATWLKGLIYGWIVVVCSNWILVPLIKGKVFGQANQVFFGGGDGKRMLATVLIISGFGLATAVIYSLLRGKNA